MSLPISNGDLRRQLMLIRDSSAFMLRFSDVLLKISEKLSKTPKSLYEYMRAVDDFRRLQRAVRRHLDRWRTSSPYLEGRNRSHLLTPHVV